MPLKKLLVAVFSFSWLLAQDSPSENIAESEISNAYNAPFSIKVENSWNFLLSGSYIYWQVKEQGFEFAKAMPADPSANISIKNMDFDYCSGFKIAAASNLHHDKWSLFCEYTRLHQRRITKAVSERDGYLIPFAIFYAEANEPSSGTDNHASKVVEKWFFSYDMLDLQIERSYYVAPHLIFKTFIGARGGWIDQKNKLQASFTNLLTDQTGTIDTESLARSSSWLIGPRIGLDTSWTICCSWRLFGNASFSLLYQHFLASFKQEDFEVLTTLDTFTKDKIGYVNPNIDLSLGLAWGKYILKNDWNVEISLGYSFLYFWNQNMLRRLSDKMLFQIETKPSDLMLHGLTATMKFDF